MFHAFCQLNPNDDFFFSVIPIVVKFPLLQNADGIRFISFSYFELKLVRLSFSFA